MALAHGAAPRVTVTAIVVAISLVAAGPAPADPPSFAFQMPEGQTAPGTGAGEFQAPFDIAADPETGRLYIADHSNRRVSEYTAWGLFVKSWGWGVADGSAELQVCGPLEPDETPDPALCREGLAGEGKGQMRVLNGGMAVDDEGNVWVGDLVNRRVQKFAPSGQFLLMLGGDVNKTKAEEGASAEQRNVCPVDPADVCQAGVTGEGPSQLSQISSDVLAYSPTADAILVGDEDGIQVFDLDGGFREEIAFEGPLAAFAGQAVNALDVGKDGNVYLALAGLEDIYKLSEAGVPLDPGKPGESSFEVETTFEVAVDARGHVYTTYDPPGAAKDVEPRILEFDASGNRLLPTKAEEDAEEPFPYVPLFGPHLIGLATNLCPGSEAPGNLYVSFFQESFFGLKSYVNAYGTAPIGCEPPPPKPPEVLAQFATSVGRDEATVKAQINPRFWPDLTYYVEYGTGKCSEGGCASKAPLTPPLLTSKAVNGPVTTAGVVLDGLAPRTVYRYRFVAQSGGGGPVFGIDPDGREGPALASPEEGLEGTFRTFASPSISPCPNDAVRVGLSAQLPDCRAYEMVSPLDKGGSDVALWEARNGLRPQGFETHRAANSGNRFAFTSYMSFGDADAAPWVSQHLAERAADAWRSEPISPPRTESPVSADLLFTDEFQAFTDDLCRAWVRHYSVAPLAAGAIEGYPNLYRRENCAEPPVLEAITTVKPENHEPEGYIDLTTRGFSADGSHVVFSTGGKLHPDVPGGSGPRLYERTDGELRFVCYLPNGEPNPTDCSAGTLVSAGSSLRNAVSDDGSHIFWTAFDDTAAESQPGHVYVRIDGAETRDVSGTVTSEPAFFWTAAADGSKAIVEVMEGPLSGHLYEVDVDTEAPSLIAKGVEGPLGASEDAARIYFGSTEDLDGPGPASVGDHNLYLYEAVPGGGGGDFTFLMELAGPDVGLAGLVTAEGTRAVERGPVSRAAQVTPDGMHATFMSKASPTPTGYDNRDATSHQPVAEVYLYGAADDELHCVSCDPSGARPASEGGLAARIQGWEARVHAPQVLSDDGRRVFFESFGPLVPRDTNETWDVYQWEEEGKGTCRASSETFSEDSGGCVDLISSGLSPRRSVFLDADPSGANVFFSTQSSLVRADYGLNDVYVARVGGGFPEPSEEEECEGEACQSPPPPPPAVMPSTESAAGPGNAPPVKPRKARRCPKGKRRVRRGGKVKCVRRRAARPQRR